jgi:TolA-binding protein
LSKPVTSAKRGRNKAASRTSPVEVIPQPQAGVLTFSDEVQSLDGEIRQLREQLARRLQQQNAQLTKMLERFER